MSTLADAVTFRLLVTPGPGRVKLLPPRRFDDGTERVEAGQAVARLLRGDGEVILRAPVGGRVAAVLAIDGGPVGRGQPVLVIEPDPVPTPPHPLPRPAAG